MLEGGEVFRHLGCQAAARTAGVPARRGAGSGGTDDDGCALRVVNFVTPVSVSDVLGYYNTRAARAGYGVQARTDGTDHVLGGSKGGRAYVVYVRKQDNGLTGVDLVTSGK